MEMDALYDDLSMGEHPGASNAFYLSNKVNELEEKLVACNVSAAALLKELTGSKTQVSALTKERDTLLRNISCLYNTAKQEVARKQANILQLREQLSTQTLTTDTIAAHLRAVSQPPSPRISNPTQSPPPKAVKPLYLPPPPPRLSTTTASSVHQQGTSHPHPTISSVGSVTVSLGPGQQLVSHAPRQGSSTLVVQDFGALEHLACEHIATGHKRQWSDLPSVSDSNRRQAHSQQEASDVGLKRAKLGSSDIPAQPAHGSFSVKSERFDQPAPGPPDQSWPTPGFENQHTNLPPAPGRPHPGDFRSEGRQQQSHPGDSRNEDRQQQQQFQQQGHHDHHQQQQEQQPRQEQQLCQEPQQQQPLCHEYDQQRHRSGHVGRDDVLGKHRDEHRRSDGSYGRHHQPSSEPQSLTGKDHNVGNRSSSSSAEHHSSNDYTRPRQPDQHRSSSSHHHSGRHEQRTGSEGSENTRHRFHSGAR